MEYVRLFWWLIIRPRQALATLDAHPRRLAFGVTSLLVHSAIAISKQLYFDAIAQPVAPPPFLAVPAARAWSVSAVLQVPTDFAQAVLFAGTVTLLAPLSRGKGSFEEQFALYSFGFAAPTIVLILSTLALTIVGLRGTLLWWLDFVAVSLYILALIALAVGAAQKLRLTAAIPLALAGLVPALAVSLAYIR